MKHWWLFLALVIPFTGAAAWADETLAALPPVDGPATGLADSAGLRATVFGTPPQDIAPLPERVPVGEIDLNLPWRLPVPSLLWFDSRLRVWFSPQKGPAPLAIVIAGTGSSGNSPKQQLLRAVLYGAGYHVLTLPSPTFPGFIVSASSTGVAGDLMQDGRDLYRTLQVILAHLPRKVRITDVDVLGYSLGGANAVILKSIDAAEHKLHIHRALMINPPVSLFSSIGRLDRLYALTLGNGDAGIERFYQQLYADIANRYLDSTALELDEDFLFEAAASILRTDAQFSTAIALTFRLALVNMFFAGDLYTRAGVVVDPYHPPRLDDSLEPIAVALRAKPFSEYFARIFAPYYLAHRPGATTESLVADNNLAVIAGTLRTEGDYYAQTNRNDLILDRGELEWLERTMGARIAVYDHGGHIGNLGDRQQVADMLDMLGGRWKQGGAP